MPINNLFWGFSVQGRLTKENQWSSFFSIDQGYVQGFSFLPLGGIPGISGTGGNGTIGGKKDAGGGVDGVGINPGTIGTLGSGGSGGSGGNILAGGDGGWNGFGMSGGAGGCNGLGSKGAGWNGFGTVGKGPCGAGSTGGRIGGKICCGCKIFFWVIGWLHKLGCFKGLKVKKPAENMCFPPFFCSRWIKEEVEVEAIEQ